MTLFKALVWENGELRLNEINLDDLESATNTYVGGKCCDTYFKVVIKDDCYDFIPCDKETAEKYALV